MKRSFIYAALMCLAIIAMVGCDKNFDTFKDPTSPSGTPSAVTNISADSLPGQIVLHWNVPADSNYYLLQINYYDHLTEEQVYKVTSIYQDSLLIDNTRKKFGNYKFSFQTFSRNNVAGNAVDFEAISGRTPITETVTATEINLTEDQLSTNNQEPSEGPIKNLIDGSSSTFFHTRWHSPQIPMPQYIQIDLKTPIDDFKFYFQNREWSQVGAEIVEIQISTDGTNWETVETINAGLPSAGGAEFTSEVFRPGKTFSYFRYNVTKTYGDKNYFNMAQFKLYDVEIDTYDPEK